MINRLILCFLLPTFTLSGCDQIFPPGVEATADRYLSAESSGDYIKMYNLVSVSDREARTLEEFRNQDTIGAMVQLIRRSSSYQIISITGDAERATALVEMTVPDVGEMFMDMFGKAWIAAMSDSNEQEITEDFKEKYKDGNLPMSTITKELVLIKEAEGWRVFLDWAKTDRIQALLDESDSLRDAGELVEADEKLRDLLAIDPDHQRAQRKRESIAKENQKIEKQKQALEAEKYALEAEKQALEEKKSYISLVELSNVKVGEGRKRSYSDPEPAVFGTVTNKGKKALTRVVLTVYFLDDRGNVIGETDYPIVTKYKKLLKPNYVKDFGYTVKDSAPSGWAKKIRAEITDIEFAE